MTRLACLFSGLSSWLPQLPPPRARRRKVPSGTAVALQRGAFSATEEQRDRLGGKNA